MKPIRLFFRFLGAMVALTPIAGIVFWLRPVEFLRQLLYVRMAMAGYESSSVTVNGIRMHYDALGPKDGRPVVLVHGLGASAEDWVAVAPYLAGAGFRVYMPDLPGYGRSEQPANFSYSIPDEARAVEGFLDAKRLPRVDLGGWSMGGWIAQKIAGDHPERVQRLMLFDAAGINEKPSWNTALFTPESAAQLDELDALLMPHPPQVPGFIAADVVRMLQKNAWVVKRALASMLAGADTTDKLLPTLKMPVLIVWGELDRIVPLEQGETMHRLVPQSQMDVVPECGHLAPEQCAAKIAPRVVEFLRQ
jgi:pimeloyl-ACP methyl ester carboxylesterase